MTASLQEFIKTGALGLIELGASRSAIEGQIGTPESWEASARRYQRATIWKYGAIEFHFQGDVLDMIFMDEFSLLSGGSKIELDAWMINGDLICPEAERLLSASGVSYRKEEFPYNENGIHLVTRSGVVLAFSGEDASRITLHSLHCHIEAITR